MRHRSIRRLLTWIWERESPPPFRTPVASWLVLLAAIHAGQVSRAALIGPGTLPPPPKVITNPESQIPIVLDGNFTDGVPLANSGREWSDVTPTAFIAPPDNSGTLLRTALGDPRANALLYSVVGKGPGDTDPSLYLMYDFAGRTNPTFAPGEFIASVTFPVTLAGDVTPENITVLFSGAAPGSGSFFDVSLVRAQGLPVLSAASVGLEGAVGFGPSLLTMTPHLLVELEVPLLIPPAFGSGFGPQGGGQNGIYSPDPAFWGANASDDRTDPPISSSIFTIMPDGSTIMNSGGVQAVPEPSSFVLAGIGLAALGVARRRRAARA